jgi:hypothetical protein
MGLIAFVIKLIHIPINNIIVFVLRVLLRTLTVLTRERSTLQWLIIPGSSLVPTSVSASSPVYNVPPNPSLSLSRGCSPATTTPHFPSIPSIHPRSCLAC